jgi:NitT/TauT family transport system substrate-binding protein
MNFQLKISLCCLLVAAALWMGACTPTAMPSPSGNSSPPATPAQDNTLRMALLPILDVLPFYIAQDQGYFAAEGIAVTLTPVKSALERDALMQAGEIDGALADLISVGLFNRETPQVKVVAMARKAYPDFPQFRILAAPGMTVNGPADLAHVPIGISQNTVIEYLSDRLLVKWGVPPDQIAIEEVSAIPTRFEMLMNGQLKVALLPDPLAQGAIAAGATLVVDDAQFTEYSQSVLVFSLGALEEKPESVRAFLRAWNKAVADLNREPNAYRDLLIEKTQVPQSIQGSYKVPPFPEHEITTEAQWNDVVAWMEEKELLDHPIPYAEAVDPHFSQEAK